MDSRCLNEIIQ